MRFLFGRLAVEPRAGAEQPLKQEGALDQIGAVVLAAERKRGAGVAVHEMRIEPVIAGRALEPVEHQR